MIAVIAGNFAQYHGFLKAERLHPKRFVYVSSRDDLAGRPFVGWIEVGQFWRNPLWTVAGRVALRHVAGRKLRLATVGDRRVAVHRLPKSKQEAIRHIRFRRGVRCS